MDDKWNSDRESVLQQSTAVANLVSTRLTATQEPVPLTSKVIEQCITNMLTRFDSTYGGFTSAPKFPMPMYCDFLMEAGWHLPQARKAVTKTLDSMFMGGMYDQVGGGFHRYSTDKKWLVPHFEKMLYDNAQLVSTYSKAFEKTGDATYATVVEETLAYVQRELSAPDGGFFSAQDAETNHLEGETYLWREAELRKVMEEAGMGDDVAFALAVYGIDQGTNFQDPHHPEEPPSNVLFLTEHPNKLATKHQMTDSEYQLKIDAIEAVLLKVRDTRDQPSTDDKIITAWNGLMITAYADAGRVFENPAWIERAMKAASFILSEMQNGNNELLRTWRNGKGGADAFLIDYGALIRGLLAIHVANHDPQMLASAIKLYDKARELFFVEGEGWYDTREGQSDLFVRTRALTDGAMPAAPSFILTDLVMLNAITRESRFLNDAIKTLDSESQLLQQNPLAAVVATQALHTLLETHPEKFNEPFEITMANPSPVRMNCEPQSIQITPGESFTVTVQLRLATGWHVNSNAPQNEYAIPLSFNAIDENITLEPLWPEGVPMISAGETVHVFSGSVLIPIVVKTNELVQGPIKLMITWQSCNEDTCLEQKTVRVPCTITVE